MTAKVIYLNVWHNGNLYQIDDEEMRRRRKMQERMEIFNAEIAYNSRGFSYYQKFIYKESSHNNLRKSWPGLIKSE